MVSSYDRAKSYLDIYNETKSYLNVIKPYLENDPAYQKWVCLIPWFKIENKMGTSKNAISSSVIVFLL